MEKEDNTSIKTIKNKKLKKSVLLDEEIFKEAKEIMQDIVDVEKSVVVLVSDSIGIFEKLFSCCKAEKDIDLDCRK